MTSPIQSVEQPEPPLPPAQTLPTMYDLPSDNPWEPGLPDEYHDLQPQLLTRTFHSDHYPPEQIFTGSDLNLYYDVHNSSWYKRPDWFLVLGVPRLYNEVDMRSSYVVWQEGVNPFVVVELLSPGTENEDLGESGQLASNSEEKLSNGHTDSNTPPRKWDVYEQRLRVPYYLVFSRYTDELHCFKLVGGVYQLQPLESENTRIWMPELNLGLGLWQGEFEGIARRWLRWYDAMGNWVLTDTEYERQRAEYERQRAQKAEAQLQQVVLNLLAQGMSVEQVASLTGLSTLQVQKIAPQQNN